MTWGKTKLFCFAFFLLCGSAAFSDEFRLKFLEVPGPKIPGIKWDEDKETQEPLLHIRPFVEAGKPTYFVVIHGKFIGQDSSLILNSTPFSPKANGRFDLEIGIEKEQTEFQISVIDAAGTVATQTYKVNFSDWESFRKGQSGVLKPKKLIFQVGTSVSGVTYYQVDGSTSTTTGFNQFGLNLQGLARYQWLPKLAFATQGSYTVLPLAVGTSGNTIRFLNIDAQAIYPLSFIHYPWNFELLADYSFRTTFQAQTSYGYSSGSFAFIYPRLERFFASQRSIWVIVRYLPVVNYGGLILNTTSYELGAQVGFKVVKLGSHWLEILCGAAQDVIQYSANGSSGAIKVNLYTVGVNFEF